MKAITMAGPTWGHKGSQGTPFTLASHPNLETPFLWTLRGTMLC